MVPCRALTTVSLILVGLVWVFDRAEAGQGSSAPTSSPPPPLIPREILFGNPDRAALRVSPDGKHLSCLAPVKGVLNVWVAPVDDVAAAKPVTKDAGRGIHIYFWAYTSRHLLYLQDQGGDENWKVYAVDVAGLQSKDL